MQWWNVQLIYTKSRKTHSTHTDIRVAVLKSFNCFKKQKKQKLTYYSVGCCLTVFFFFSMKGLFSVGGW